MTDQPRSRRPRSNRKVSDEDIIRLNALGCSLMGIGRMTNTHITTISDRLKNLGLRTFDTRRSFMDDICSTFTQEQLDWLAKQIGDKQTIREYIQGLIAQRMPAPDELVIQGEHHVHD